MYVCRVHSTMSEHNSAEAGPRRLEKPCTLQDAKYMPCIQKQVKSLMFTGEMFDEN